MTASVEADSLSAVDAADGEQHLAMYCSRVRQENVPWMPMEAVS